MKWGIYDAKDNVWLGTNDAGTGPRLFDEEDLARIAAQVIVVQMGWPATRAHAREWSDRPLKLKDELSTKMTPLEALNRIEKGTL